MQKVQMFSRKMYVLQTKIKIEKKTAINQILSDLLLIASAKPRSARGASHQPAFMSGCLTISHTCLPCLPGKGSLLY